MQTENTTCTPQATPPFTVSPSDLLPTHPSSPDWKERANLSLEQQWTLAQDLLVLGRRVLSRHAAQIHAAASLTQVERILNLATRLARLSTDLAQQSAQSQDQCPKCCAARLRMEADLQKIYGEKTSALAPSPSPEDLSLPKS